MFLRTNSMVMFLHLIKYLVWLQVATLVYSTRLLSELKIFIISQKAPVWCSNPPTNSRVCRSFICSSLTTVLHLRNVCSRTTDQRHVWIIPWKKHFQSIGQCAFHDFWPFIKRPMYFNFIFSPRVWSRRNAMARTCIRKIISACTKLNILDIIYKNKNKTFKNLQSVQPQPDSMHWFLPVSNSSFQGAVKAIVLLVHAYRR